MRTSSRFGSPQFSAEYGPSQGGLRCTFRGTRVEGGGVRHRAVRLARTPDPDLAAGRRLYRARRPKVDAVQSRLPPWTKANQSMSPMWPRRQARTKRIGHDVSPLPIVIDDDLTTMKGIAMDQKPQIGWPPRSRRHRVMNHSGNRHAVTPVAGAVGSWSSRGGVRGAGPGVEATLRAWQPGEVRGPHLPGLRPMVEPTNEDRVVREVNESTGTERGDQLALTSWPGGAGRGAGSLVRRPRPIRCRRAPGPRC